MEILAAVENCFVKSGFHTASMQDIAREAGVSMGTLYRYFTNKEAIISAFAESDLTAATDAVAAWGRSMAPGRDFQTLLRGILRAAAVPARAAIEAEIYAEGLRNAPLRRLLARHQGAMLKTWEAAIAAQEKSGALRLRGASDEAAALILSLVDGYATHRLLMAKGAAGIGDDRVIGELMDLLGLDDA